MERLAVYPTDTTQQDVISSLCQACICRGQTFDVRTHLPIAQKVFAYKCLLEAELWARDFPAMWWLCLDNHPVVMDQARRARFIFRKGKVDSDWLEQYLELSFSVAQTLFEHSDIEDEGEYFQYLNKNAMAGMGRRRFYLN